MRVRACVRACVRWVIAYVYVCVRACVRVRVRVYILFNVSIATIGYQAELNIVQVHMPETM